MARPSTKNCDQRDDQPTKPSATRFTNSVTMFRTPVHCGPFVHNPKKTRQKATTLQKLALSCTACNRRKTSDGVDYDAAVQQVQQILDDSMQELCPDILKKTEHLLAERWYKDVDEQPHERSKWVWENDALPDPSSHLTIDATVGATTYRPFGPGRIRYRNYELRRDHGDFAIDRYRCSHVVVFYNVLRGCLRADNLEYSWILLVEPIGVSPIGVSNSVPF